MIRVFTILIALLCVLLLTTCKESEFPEPPYPRVETLSITAINESGVTFQSEVTNADKYSILDHGFVWGKEEVLSTSSSLRINLGELSGNAEFEARIESGLEKNSRYTVVAFVTTARETVYSVKKAFTSEGSVSPEILSIAPTQGTWGDTLTIEGKFFSNRIQDVAVLFGSTSATVIEATLTTVRCIVPNNIASKTVPVHITIAGYEATSLTPFTLVTPEIESINPQTGTFGNDIVITGKYFNALKQKNTVLIGGYTAEVLEATPTTLKVKVPPALDAASNPVKVKVNLQTSVENISFTLTPPSITSLSANQALIGSTLTITGTNFSTVKASNKVMFGNNPAIVVTATSSTLTVEVPQGVYDQRTFNVKVAVAAQTASSGSDFTIGDPWVRRSVMNPVEEREYGITLSFPDKAYVGLGSKFSLPYKTMWEYTPSANRWNAVASYPGQFLLYPISFTIGNYGYVGGGMNIYTGQPMFDFWRFDPSNNTWTRLNDIPFETDAPSVCISTDTHGFTVLEQQADNFLQYDPVNDTWTIVSTLYMEPPYYWRYQSGVFLEGKLYYFAADVTTAEDFIFVYNLDTREWENSFQLENDRTNYVCAFTLGGKGYIGGSYNLYKIDPELGEVEKTDLMAPSGFSFQVGEKGYVWHGTTLWEFDPAFE